MLAVQELQKLWKLHAKLLAENRIAEAATNKKITSASDLKIGKLVLVKTITKFHLTQLTSMITRWQKSLMIAWFYLPHWMVRKRSVISTM